MKRRYRNTKRKLVILLFPLILIVFFTLAYGAWQDFVSLNISFTVSQEPTIEVTSFLLNAPNNIVTLIVDNTTKTIENTDPDPLQILIKIINNGSTPITKLVVNNTFPTDWNPVQQPLMQYIQTDGTTILIDPTYFTVVYDPTTKTLCISLPDIRKATGKFLNQNETIFISLNTAYALIGNQLPPEYENTILVYTNSVITTAYFTSWQSKPTTSTSIFTTNISWI
mgnify:CR=1 FL=1